MLCVGMEVLQPRGGVLCKRAAILCCAQFSAAMRCDADATPKRLRAILDAVPAERVGVCGALRCPAATLVVAIVSTQALWGNEAPRLSAGRGIVKTHPTAAS